MFRSKKDVERHVNDVLSKITNENEKYLRGYTFARLFFQVKDYDAAKKHLNGFLSLRDHHAPAHKLMAQVYEAGNNAENALQSYKRSLEIDSHQRDVVLKICELYCQLSVDHDTARYWADRAEQIYPHNEIVFKLREKIVSAEGEPNRQELENLIATELEAHPKNISHRIRLLRLYLDTERVKEAYSHATMIESKRLFPFSVEWYYLLGDIFEAFQQEFASNLDTEFYINYLSALDRLILLTLAESHALSFDNTKKQYSINDAAAVFKTFDQLLTNACNKKVTESSWMYFLNHMKGQMYYNMSILLLKRAKMDQGNRKEAIRFSAGLAVICYSFKPVNPLQEIWFSQLQDNQKAFTHYFQQACLRISFIGHIITDLCKEDKGKWLQKLKGDVCIKQVKERIYNRVLGSEFDKNKLSASYFIKDFTFENTSLEYPSEVVLQEYDKAAYKLCSDSLHHLVWLELQQPAIGSKFHDNLTEVFKGLQYSNKNLSKGSCESLCVLDIEAYLYASVYQTMIAIEKKKSFPTQNIPDSQLSFMPDIADPMCSTQQASWWKAAYGLHSCTIKDKLGEARRDLSHGLEVIRGIGNHGMEVQLIVHLARTFADKADYFLKERSITTNLNKKLKPENVTALQHRSIYYWNLALSVLEIMASGHTPKSSKETMFVGVNKMLSKDEIRTLQEDGRLYIAVHLMDSERLDEAAEILSKLDNPYGSYYLALTLKKMASLEDRTSNTLSALLTKAKNSIHDTMDRIKDDKQHPLNKEIYLVLEDIESELGTYNAMNESKNESDEVDTFYGSPEVNNSVYVTPNSHKSVAHSTPRPSLQFTLTKAKSSNLNSTSRKHFEPSPERLDAQMRALSLNQDTIVKTLIDQQKAFMETNITVATALRQNNEVLEQLKKLLEELKISGIRGQARNSRSRQHSYAKGQTDDEEYTDFDPNNQLDFYNEEGTEDYRNAGYPYNPPGRLVHDAVAAATPLNYVMPPAIPPGPPPALNHYNYQYSPHAVMPPQEPRPPYYHPAPGQGLPFSEGQQLPQFQFHVANPVGVKPPPIMTSIPQSVQLPPPAVNLPPMQPPPTNVPQTTHPVPMPMANPWTKTGPHAFQISLPPSSSFAVPPPVIAAAPPASQSELKSMLAIQPAPTTAAISAPFSQGFPPVSVAPPTSAPSTSLSIFGSIAKTPEKSQLDRSRCDSENTASPDGDLEREVMGDFKPLIPLPAEIVVETGEENELVLFEDRAKLYRFVDQEWKERGTGIVKILHHNASGRVRLLMRRDQVLKVCANHYMSADMILSPLKSCDRAWTWVAQDFADEVLKPEHFCIRFKTAEVATTFKAAFDKAISIAKETEGKKVISPRVSASDSSTAQYGFGTQFLPKAGAWSCPSCYVSNAAEKSSCVACESKKPFRLSDLVLTQTGPTSTTVTSSIGQSATAQNSIMSFKGISNESQFKFGSSAFNNPVNVSSNASQNTVGGFTFSSAPMITKAVEPDLKEREILVVSTKDKTTPQVSKVNQPTSSPFSGFSFGKLPLSVQVSDSARSVTVTSIKPLTELSSKALSTASPTSINTLSGTISTNDTSLSKLQSMVQGVKPTFTFESKSSPKTDLSSSFGTTTVDQPVSNTTRLSTDGSPEEFIPTAEFKPVVPLPALVDVKTGEEEEEKLFEERAKLFRYDPNTKEWKERGTGDLKILHPKNSHKYRILMRRDQVLKICANHYILPEMKLETKGDKSWVWFAQDFSEEDLVQQQFAARFKTADIAKKFQTVFLDCQAKLKEPEPKKTVPEDKCKGNSATFEKLVSASKEPPQVQNIKPLSELFKPDAGSWECKMCYVRNKASDSKCASCEFNPSCPSSTDDRTNCFLPFSPKPTTGFGDLFKPKEGTWECKSCYVRNTADKAKCVSCDAVNNIASATKSPSVFGVGNSSSLGAFKFGSSDTPKSTFSFGPSTGAGFVFGVKPESQPATFSFGQKTIINKENDTKPQASIFGETGKVFGDKNDTPQQSVFGSSTKFSFGDLAASQPESETQEFKFGSPQKYEFSFEGVKPRSPPKAPKSPRSPASPSDADEEEEEDSDVDNIYFQPVIPLPPKIDVKTGEEDEKVLFCQRAKLFRFANSEWKERGIGDIKILLDEKTNRVRFLMRREQVLKVCLNHHLTKDITFEWRNDKSLSWTATDFSENEPSPELLAVRFKTSELAEEFKAAIDDALAKSGVPVITSPKSTTAFSFKTDAPATTESPFTFGSLSTQFGTTQQKPSVFGGAAGFSFKESKEGDKPFSFSLNDNKSTGSFLNKSSVFGSLGVTPLQTLDDDIEVVYEPTLPLDKIKLAEKYQLPKFFYSYENKPPCPGCIGCDDHIPAHKATSQSEETAEKSPTPAPTQETQPTLESDAPFSSTKFNTFSFSEIASNSHGFQELAKSPGTAAAFTGAGKAVFAGAGTPLFQNLNVSANEEGGDEVAQGPDIHFEPVIPMPDLIEVKTGEEDEVPIFAFRAKLFRYDPNTKQWKERGVGDIKILSHKDKVRFRVILRRDQVHNVACNHCITEDMALTSLATSENALCWTALDYSDGQGEATQFAVRFKHKEQTVQFKETFLDCQEKLKQAKQNIVEEAVPAAIEATPSPAGATGGGSAEEESESEEEELEELIFEKRTTLEVFDEAQGKYKVEGMGCLRIVYDDTVFGYRVFMENDEERLLCEHLIAVQTCLRTEGKSATWAAIDSAMEPMVRRQFRVTFSSKDALEEFKKHFDEGKEIAITSPIVEKSD